MIGAFELQRAPVVALGVAGRAQVRVHLQLKRLVRGVQAGYASPVMGKDATNALITMKVAGVDKDKLAETVKPYVLELIDVREI